MTEGACERPTQAYPGAGPASAPPVVRNRTWLDGRYELCEVIGRGGMSTVYRARDHVLERDVAIKVFRATTGLDDTDARRRREVDLLSSLDDPGLIAVLDADVSDEAARRGVPYLVTALVDGPTLAERICTSPLSEHATAQLGAAMCRTLAYIHRRGILHRDVKPANILLPHGDLAMPKLVDFGIAVPVDGDRMTVEGTTVGTASYLSPEQVTGAPLTPASDVYSLGLVLIQAFTGTTPFPGTGVDSAMARLDHDPVIPRRTSAALAEVLSDMTARDPQARPDAAAAGARLRTLAEGDASRPRHLVIPAMPRRRRRGQVVVLAAAVLAGCAGLGAGLRLSSEQPDGGPPAAVGAAPAAAYRQPAVLPEVPAVDRHPHPAPPTGPPPAPITPPTFAVNPAPAVGSHPHPPKAKRSKPDRSHNSPHDLQKGDWGD